MSEHAIKPPARQMDEFEELVYEYTTRMGLGNEEVRLETATSFAPLQISLRFIANFHQALGRRRAQLQPALRIRDPWPAGQGLLPHQHHPGSQQLHGQLARWLRCDTDRCSFYDDPAGCFGTGEVLSRRCKPQSQGDLPAPCADGYGGADSL